MSNSSYKSGTNQSLHYCHHISQWVWIPSGYPCPHCGQHVPAGESSQQTPQWGQPTNPYSQYNYHPATSPYAQTPTLPSNDVVPPDYYSSAQRATQPPPASYPTAQPGSVQTLPSSPPPNQASQAAAARTSNARWICDLCPPGQSVFSREPDLTRHKRTVHEKEQLLSEGGGYDCPHPGCDRKGRRAFTRYDHFIEHRRGYHKEDIEKRGGSKKRG